MGFTSMWLGSNSGCREQSRCLCWQEQGAMRGGPRGEHPPILEVSPSQRPRCRRRRGSRRCCC